MLRKFLDLLITPLYGKRSFYSLFYFMFLRGLRGIEQGSAYAWVSTSGEINVLKLLKSMGGAPVVIDGGANVGKYSQMVLDTFGNSSDIICFEPSAKAFELLKSNHTGKSNIIFENLALTETTGTFPLHYDNPGSAIASLFPIDYSHYDLEMKNIEEINGITIDQYLEENKIECVDLLKLDLEGYELFALNGATESLASDKIRMLQFEMGRPNIDSRTFFRDFYKKLSGRYKMYRILSFGLQYVPEYSYEFELFLGCNYLAIHKSIDLDGNRFFQDQLINP